ncbi:MULTISPECIES: hypothetical protein [Capnocytophaga]|jgi:hypothetical protein|uniref:hypothetical protein n=1 Tax=Capnocytophaga sputigena TaxID=1019 RepID=UPI0028D0E2A0|nr:hypothetical protein [Capnocytophaga sputigena]
MTKAFELFKESLEKISDEDFAKLLDEMENDPQGQGITIGDFIDLMNQNILVSDTIIVNNEKNKVSYLFDIESTTNSTNTTNKNFLEAA